MFGHQPADPYEAALWAGRRELAKGNILGALGFFAEAESLLDPW